MPGTLLIGSSLAHGLGSSSFNGPGPGAVRQLADGRRHLMVGYFRSGASGGSPFYIYDVTTGVPSLFGAAAGPGGSLDGGRIFGKPLDIAFPRYLGTDTQYEGSGDTGGMSGFDLGADSSPDSTPDYKGGVGWRWGLSSGGFTGPGDQKGEVYYSVNVSGFVQIGNLYWLNCRTGAAGSMQVSREGGAGACYAGHPGRLVCHPSQPYLYSLVTNGGGCSVSNPSYVRIFNAPDAGGISDYTTAALVPGLTSADFQRFNHASKVWAIYNSGGLARCQIVDLATVAAPAIASDFAIAPAGYQAIAGWQGTYHACVIAGRYALIPLQQSVSPFAWKLAMVDLLNATLIDTFDLSKTGFAGNWLTPFVGGGNRFGVLTSSHILMWDGVPLPTGWTVGARVA